MPAPVADSTASDTPAAVVDGHSIPMRDVELLCLRSQRGYVVDQMIQNYVVDRECKRRGIVFSDAQIDSQVADLRKQYAPATLEDSLKSHGWTMAELRQQLRFKLERQRLVDDEMKPVSMTHCREILVKISEGCTGAQALSTIRGIQTQLSHGKDFADLAEKYSEVQPRRQGGDIGVLYGNMLGSIDAPVLAEAMALSRGAISKSPVRTVDGYCLIQAVSTSNDHTSGEDSLYKDADAQCRKTQAMFLEPKVVGDLIRNSRITYIDDADLVAEKPLPDAAAVIDGNPIPMKDVLARCLAENGRQTTDILVQNYVVDRECDRRGITVSESEIDRAVADLRARIAPHMIEEGLPLHHTTMAGLRRDFKQQIERTKLVVDQVKPARMVHCRVSMLPAAKHQTASSVSGSGTQDSSKDLGIVYPGMQNVDTAILNTALTMKTGQTTPQAVKTYGGSALIQVVSASDDHPESESASYAEALSAYREQAAQPLIPQAIMTLVKKAKVVLYTGASRL